MFSSRRQFIATAAASGLPSTEQRGRKQKIVVTGGHPGDPECGCAGTVARFAAAGHDVALLYMNRGEGFCKGAEPTQCGAVRTAEAEKACRILGARPVFAGQIDGQSVVDNAQYDRLHHLLESENPDIIFAQWPIDKHRDHRALSMLVLDSWQRKKAAAFYYYEVFDDTMMFTPTEYVDISPTEIEPLRHAACYAHASQDPDKWYPGQINLTRFRGLESGYSQAEAFVRH